MRTLKLLIPAAVLTAVLASAAFAQEAEGVIGPGSSCGLEPSPHTICPDEVYYGGPYDAYGSHYAGHAYGDAYNRGYILEPRSTRSAARSNRR